AGQAGFAGHLNIGNGAQIGGGSGVFHDIPAGMKVIGTPATEFHEYARREMRMKRLLSKKRD
ncbi:MAG TPA: UDP-3-O-(3-hydroxymyristoyl)glucosamine N-acyltransferase, partial [Thermoanaerobaculia bacterium]|nr:UDP-3-O-(3-hydroxymyristoyl)glucosamine N-acyltransferase [Thermoanaerobaculia bacterium]